MHRRLSSADKGKAVALEHLPAPRKARVRVSEPDLSSAQAKHSLTIIGRVTNPSMQKVWSLLPFFTDHWKCDIPPVGSDLGLGLFQFQFEREADLLTVLEKQPYHYARWMIILQRWEPTVSPDFPSMLPFWIKIQGIPIHLWKEETIQTIGEDLGTFETSEITATSIRMRVHVNGRLPLLKHYVVEYPNGDEVSATLVYERLERHCSHCNRLDHEMRDCLEAKHQKKALIASQEQPPATGEKQNSAPSRNQTDLSLEASHRDLPIRRQDDYANRQRGRSLSRGSTDKQSYGPSRQRLNNKEAYRGRHPYRRQEWQPRVSQVRDSQYEVSKYRSDRMRGDSHSALSPRDMYDRRDPGRDEELRSPSQNKSPPQEVSSSSRYRHQPSVRGDPLRMCNPPRQETVDSALDKIKDTMHTYTMSADPSESAARKERLRQAELQGILENNAQRMARIANSRETNEIRSVELLEVEPKERTPIADRLGPNPSSPRTSGRLSLSGRLGPLNEVLPEREMLPPTGEAAVQNRVPIADRLGPIELDAEEDNPIMGEIPTDIKKKRGRPPGSRTGTSRAGQVTEESSRKKKNLLGKPPSGRTKTTTEIVRPRRVTKAAKNKRATPRASRTSRSSGTPTSSENLPIANMIPPAARRRMDFRGPSNPAP